MNKYLFIIFLSFLNISVFFSQEQNILKVKNEEIIKAKPENGLDNFKLEFAQAIDIPIKNIIEINQKKLKILISFRVNENGEIDQVKVLNDKHELTEEISKTFKNLPNWIPASKNGVKVASFNTLPIVLNTIDHTKEQLPFYEISQKEIDFFYDEFNSNMHYKTYFWDSYYHKKNNYAMGLNASQNNYSYEIKFEINEEGKFENIETFIDNKFNSELNKSTIKALKKCTNWKPFIIDNQKVRATFKLPIKIKIIR